MRRRKKPLAKAPRRKVKFISSLLRNPESLSFFASLRMTRGRIQNDRGRARNDRLQAFCRNLPKVRKGNVALRVDNVNQEMYYLYHNNRSESLTIRRWQLTTHSVFGEVQRDGIAKNCRGSRSELDPVLLPGNWPQTCSSPGGFKTAGSFAAFF